MAIISPSQLKAQSASRLAASGGDLKRLVLLFTGVTVGLSLAVNGLNLYLNQQISTTGGLGGLGMRSVLQTIQTLLTYISTFFTPFWQAGFLFATIRAARGQQTRTGDMLQGFRRFGSILGYSLWQILISMALCFILAYVSSFLFLLTPSGTEFGQILMPLMEDGSLILSDGTMNLDALPIDTLLPTMIPLMVIYAALITVALAYVNYHLRMTSFLMLEGPARNAFASMVVSTKMMKGHKLQLLKLDLSFWWFYALEAVLLLVLYLDVLLPMLGVTLPISETAAYFLALAVYGVLELVLHLWKKAEVDVTYAAAYDLIYQEFAARYLRPNNAPGNG